LSVIYYLNCRAEHVQLYDVRKCPFNWPDAGQCVEIVMAVPAFTTSVTPYELSTLHLQQIWNMVRNGNYLPSPWLVYEMPNSTAVIWWACVFFGIVFLFILLIVLAWRVEIHQSSIGYFFFLTYANKNLSFSKNFMHYVSTKYNEFKFIKNKLGSKLNVSYWRLRVIIFLHICNLSRLTINS